MAAATGADADDVTAGMDEIAGVMEKLHVRCVEGLLPAVHEAFGKEDPAKEMQRVIDRGCELANTLLLLRADSKDERRKRVDQFLRTLFYVQQAYGAAKVSARLLQSGVDGQAEGGGTDEELAAGVSRFSRLDPEEANAMQQVLLYMLNCAQARGYRRRESDCYKRRLTADGHDTHSWEHACTMRDFVYDATRKELNFDMWLALTSNVRGNVGAVVDHLMHCQDVQLPDLRKDRHVFAFSDGIYLAAKDEFVRYPAASVPSDVVAAKYFDAPLGQLVDACSAGADWYAAIPTPHMQSILDFQEMGQDVARWMYVLIGRLMYDVNEKDAWQVLPYLKGAASSGKSTILMRVCRALYEANDVGVMSNNIEKKFGLSAFYDKYMFIGPEIKNDVALEQAEFQSIVSGETVQIAIKFRTAQTVDWTTPGILAGNEVPGWVDNSGSVKRRIVLFDFPNTVTNGDMELGKKLEAELPAILLKANRAYLDAVRRFARDNIWKHLPEAFHRAKQELAEDTNSIVHFMGSGQLRFAQDAYMPLVEFTTAYQMYVDRMGLTKQRTSADALKDPLLSYGCRIKKGVTLRWPRDGDRVVTGVFITGVDLALAERPSFRDDPLGG